MLIQQMTPGVIVWLCGFILRRGSGIYMKRKVVDVPCTLLIYIVVLLLATYFILQVILATPLFMLYCFFAIYTRKGFIAFWNSMPIFQGNFSSCKIHV